MTSQFLTGKHMRFKKILSIIGKSFKYNLKIIFANKFIYFLLFAVAFFLLVVIINLFDADSNPHPALIYYWLLVPGILMIFYPTVFGIQNDADTRILEILFGIPNYRYKVWIIRLAAIYVVIFILLLILAMLSNLALTSFAVLSMVFQLMFPIFFLGSVAFMFSTLIRNGYGTAVVLVLISMVFWILSDSLVENKWNLFLNPFHIPEDVSDLVWQDIVLKNRIYLLVGTTLSILYGLFNLQKREKFI